MLNEELLATWEKGDLARTFAVVSWGCTATKWVAKALNAIPDVFAVHGGNGIIRSLFPATENLDDLAYVRTLRMLGAGYALAGDVHGIARTSVRRLRDFLGDNFQAAVLVRDPAPRLRSQIGLFEQNGYDEQGWPGLDYIKTMHWYERVAEIIDEPRKKFFAHGANCLNAIGEEVEVGPVFRSEDLTTDPVEFTRFVAHLSGETIRLPMEQAESIVRMSPIHSHQRSKPGAGLQTWQLRIIRAVVSACSWKLYEQLGYDIPEEWRDARSKEAA